MGIKRFFDTTVIVSRLRVTSGSKRAFSSTATVDGAVQALSVEARQSRGIIDEKGWKAWFPLESDIVEGDRITDDDGMVFNVREIVKKDYGINQHLEVILMEFNA